MDGSSSLYSVTYYQIKGNPALEPVAVCVLTAVGLKPGWQEGPVDAWRQAAYKLARNRGTWRHAVNAWRMVGDDMGWEWT